MGSVLRSRYQNITCPAQDLCEPHAVARNRLDLKTAAFVLHPLRNQAMENLPNGHLLTDLQHFWNSPQAQLLFQQITTQRNLETHQMSPCLPQRHYIPIPPPSPLPHKYPPPSIPPLPHPRHLDPHYLAPSTHGPHSQIQNWQWPSQPQHPSPSPQTPTLDWNHPQGPSYSPTSPHYITPYDLSPDLSQHFHAQHSLCGIQEQDTAVRPHREPSTSPEPKLTGIEPPISQESLHDEAHREEEPSKEKDSQSSSSTYIEKKKRGKRRRPSEHSPQRKHKKRRKHSSSSYSSHSYHGHTHNRIMQETHRVNFKDAPRRHRKRNNHAFTIQKEERWLTLSHAVGKKASSPPTAQMLCDCIRTVLHKGGFAAIPHLRSMSQIDMLHRPHSSKDRATQCVLRLPPPKGSVRAKSCGSITFYSTRWGVATTEGNVMINANSSITRCVRIALEAACKEITFPIGSNLKATPSHPHTATLQLAPKNLSEAINQCVAFLGPEQAATILAMKPSSAAPGEAAATQELVTTLLQTKSSSSSKHPTSHKR